MPRKKQSKTNGHGPKPQTQALQLKAPPEAVIKRPDQRRITKMMNTFVRAYESNCGNISASCVAAGISRRSYYRWIHGTRPIYRRFQRKLDKIHPRQKLLDAAQSVLTHHLQEKNLTAAMFTFNTFGKAAPASPELSDLLERVARAYQTWLNDHETATIEEKMRWLGRFAAGGRVPPNELAAKVGLKIEPTGG